MSRHRHQHSLDSPTAEAYPPHPSYERHFGQQNHFGGDQRVYQGYQGDQEHQHSQVNYTRPRQLASTAFASPRQPQPYPLAGLMMGGNVAIIQDYHYATVPQPFDHSQTLERHRGANADHRNGEQSLAFDHWDGEMSVKDEEYDSGGGWSSPEEVGGQSWDSISGRDPRQGTQQPSEQAYEYHHHYHAQQQPRSSSCTSPHGRMVDLPPLPALPIPPQTNFGSPPVASSHSFGPSSVPASDRFDPPRQPYSQFLSFSAPDSRSYPSFASFADCDSRPGGQSHSDVLEGQRRPRPVYHSHRSAPSVPSGSGHTQDSLLAAMLDDHRNSSLTTHHSPSYSEYSNFHRSMSMSPRSPNDNGHPLLAESPERMLSTSPSAHEQPLHPFDPLQAPPGSPPDSKAAVPSAPVRRGDSKPTAKRKRGTIIKEMDPLTGRPISPITGLPTKVISKRGWPPKDIAKRVYTCPFEGCERIFGRPSARETHIRSHNGTQPFICPISTCQRPFSVFSNLKRHMIVHPTVDFRGVSVGDLPHIHCKETEVGAILVWDDEEEEEAEGAEVDESMEG